MMKISDFFEEFILALLSGMALFTTEYLSTHVLVDSGLKAVGAFAVTLGVALRSRMRTPPSPSKE